MTNRRSWVSSVILLSGSLFLFGGSGCSDKGESIDFSCLTCIQDDGTDVTAKFRNSLDVATLRGVKIYLDDREISRTVVLDQPQDPIRAWGQEFARLSSGPHRVEFMLIATTSAYEYQISEIRFETFLNGRSQRVWTFPVETKVMTDGDRVGFDFQY